MRRFTLNEFRDHYKKFFSKNKINQSNLEKFFRSNFTKLPLFYEGHFVKIKSKEEYKEWGGEKTIICEKRWLFKDSKSIIVDVKSLVGDSWVFSNEFTYERPIPERLARLFLAKKPEDIPALFATRISKDKYYTDDGNHRIYAAYLKGEKVHIFVEGEFLNCDINQYQTK